MSKDRSNDNEQENFRKALTQQGLTPGPEIEKPSDGIKAALKEAADRSTGWIASQIHTAGQDLVSRVLLGERFDPPPERDEPAKEDRAREAEEAER